MGFRHGLVMAVLAPLRVFRFMSGLTRDMFCPGCDDPEARRSGRIGSLIDRYRVSFGGGTESGRQRSLSRRISNAGKRANRRGSQ